MQRWIAVAEVARPHGVRGELRLRVFNAESDLLLKKPPIKLRFGDGAERDAVIVHARAVNKAILVELRGLGDRNEAEELRGAEVLVPRDAFPELEDGEFYACDVEGARATVGGAAIGKVVGMEAYPTCAVLVVEKDDGTKIEVPLVDAYVKRIDARERLVELVTIEGL